MTKRSAQRKKKPAAGSVNIPAGGDYAGGSVTKAGGDVNIGGHVTKAGGDVVHGDKVGGDKVGRDKITTTGAQADQLAAAFAQLMKVAQQASPARQAEAMQKIDELQKQIEATQPQLGLIGQSLKWLKKNVPGVSAALNTVLNQPIVGQGIKDIAAVILED